MTIILAQMSQAQVRAPAPAPDHVGLVAEQRGGMIFGTRILTNKRTHVKAKMWVTDVPGMKDQLYLKGHVTVNIIQSILYVQVYLTLVRRQEQVV